MFSSSEWFEHLQRFLSYSCACVPSKDLIHRGATKKTKNTTEKSLKLLSRESVDWTVIHWVKQINFVVVVFAIHIVTFFDFATILENI